MFHKPKKSLGQNKFSEENLSPDTFSHKNHKAKKYLGQNFLKSQEALLKMCEAGEICTNDTIIEIGPGKGALTEKLLERVEKVIAIEKDNDLIEILKEKFKNELENKKLLLLNMDVLDFDPKNFDLDEGKYKIVANIPYNITGLIIKKFLSKVIRPSNMTLLVQKEVAERIVAKDNKESILSLSVKAYSEPKYIMKVGKRFFSPSPKVDSAIVSIRKISNKFSNSSEEKSFFELIKAGFAHKRKVLISNLEALLLSKKFLEVGLPEIQTIFEKLGISEKSRAEDIPYEKWLAMNKLLSK